MSSPAELLLSRLDRVRERGPGSWVARCPAHADRSPSLSVRETPDGVLLLHCFAGCPATDVVAAAGLDLADLFPPRPADRRARPRSKPPVPWRDVVRLLHHHLLVVAMGASDIAAGRTLSPDDVTAILNAAGFMQEVLEEVGA